MLDIYDKYYFNRKWADEVAKFEDGVVNTYTLKENGETCYFQYIKRDISKELPFLDKDIYFDIITPFDYGGFYYTNELILEEFLKKFALKCKQENIISGFFRFNPLLKTNYSTLNKYIDVIKLQDHIILPLEENYKLNFSKSKVQSIKKSAKYDYDFINCDNLDNFYPVYLESMKRVDANNYFKFDKKILTNLINFGKIFSIRYDNQTVASIFIIEDKKDIYYFLGASLSSYLKYEFNSLLLQLIAEYYLNNKDNFFLGGGKSGLYQYKSKFSKKTVPFYIGKKVFNKDIYDKLASLSNNKNNDFFPAYRKKII